MCVCVCVCVCVRVCICVFGCVDLPKKIILRIFQIYFIGFLQFFNKFPYHLHL